MKKNITYILFITLIVLSSHVSAQKFFPARCEGVYAPGAILKCANGKRLENESFYGTSVCPAPVINYPTLKRCQTLQPPETGVCYEFNQNVSVKTKTYDKIYEGTLNGSPYITCLCQIGEPITIPKLTCEAIL